MQTMSAGVESLSASAARMNNKKCIHIEAVELKMISINYISSV